MKLSADQFKRFCTHPSPGISALLLYAEDTFSRGYHYNQFLDSQGITSHSITEIDEALILKGQIHLGDFFRSPGFFASDALYMHIPDATDKLVPHLEVFQKTAPSYVGLFLESAYLGPRSKLRTFGEKSTNIAMMACYPLSDRDIKTMIQRMLQHPIEPQALEIFAAAMMESPTCMEAEVQKLKTYVADKDTISRLDVEAILTSRADRSIDDLVQAFLTQNQSRLTLVLNQLKDQGDMMPIGAIRMLCPILMRLYRLKSLMQSGLNLKEASLKMTPPLSIFQQKTIEGYIHKWSLQRMSQTLQRLSSLEGGLKSHSTIQDILFMHTLVALARP